jgi:folate-dependent phosphoribosylglycinamide formyltransferase PurN
MTGRPRSVLICHGDEPLHLEGVARWLATVSDLRGIVVIHDRTEDRLRRVRRELGRSGLLGFVDVLLFRLYYQLRWHRADAAWRRRALKSLSRRFPVSPAEVERIDVRSPNEPAAEGFLRSCQPDLAVALCKHLLKERIFRIPTAGVFVMHPGICPEYRNAHGCFWAMATGDLERVGMTLLRIDAGVDTGPIFGHFTVPIREGDESHIVIQHRVVLENLDAVWARLAQVITGAAQPVDVRGRPSAVWGQPRLSAVVRRWLARRRR